MSKKYSPRKIKSKRSYTFRELANIYNIHIKTAQQWHKEGLKPLEGSNNPYLFMGHDIKDFLIKKTQKRRTELKENEVYCVKCRKGIIPIDITEVETKNKLGGDKVSTIIKGKCPICNTKVNKFGSKNEDKTNINKAL